MHIVITLRREFLLLLQPCGLDVIGDEIATRGRDQQRGLTVGGRCVHIRLRCCAASGPGEAAHTLKEERVEFALLQQILNAILFLAEFGYGTRGQFLCYLLW
jgi:hypothetical protein